MEFDGHGDAYELKLRLDLNVITIYNNHLLQLAHIVKLGVRRKRSVNYVVDLTQF
jgi:hypothetical protein